MAMLMMLTAFTGLRLAVSGDIRNLPLNSWPMVMTHDAATGYLPYNRILHPINTWAITQPSDTHTAITTQLNCGARAIDLRPKVAKDGSLVMHHDVIDVDVPLSKVIQELLSWSAAHSADEDFLFVSINHCWGDNCMEKAKQAFLSAGLPTTAVTEDCNQLARMTFGEALTQSKLPNGGHLLVAVDDACVEYNFQGSITCSGHQSEALALAFDFGAAANATRLGAAANATPLGAAANASRLQSGTYTCYSDSSTKAFPMKRMFDYLKGVSSGGPVSGRLSSMQALWQESKITVEIGELHFSSLLLDESKSGLNKQVADAVMDGPTGMFPHLNLLEVNNVCDGGVQLLTAVRKYALDVANALPGVVLV